VTDAREWMRRRPAALASGLTEWLRGEDTIEAEAASEMFGELVARAVDYLRAQADGGKDVKR
jgi:hypothetical protein